MTTSGKTRSIPNLSLRLVSKRVRLHFQATIPSINWRWLLALFVAFLLWLLPSLTEYFNIVMVLLKK